MAYAQGRFNHFSPTGWNSDYHFSSYVHGGYANKPGAYISRPSGARGNFAAGGGGWGADGGSTGSAGAGGEGGNAIKRTGEMSYKFEDREGNPSLGVVYGNKEE